MKFEKDEIEHYLYLYPYAAKKCAEKDELKSHSLDLATNDMEYGFNSYLVQQVKKWLDFLYPDEKEMIIYRYFKRYNYEQISIKLNYSNHSGVLQKTNRIIKKIERRLANA